ncbi:GNAT family N-acetyltransferase [Sphingomonas sp. GlSt437]|uniref:GNAT family N-acetyltransferase n=1 Tax=Sphingomonas sp. GlSt437 TaxID=3389970 RepID=UPI003A86FFDC
MALTPLDSVAPKAIEALLDRAFGTDRHGRTAYRLRAGTSAIGALSFAAIDGTGRLLGSIQCWPVEFLGDDGRRVPMVMVGPVAVDPEVQRGGIGHRLMATMLAAAAANGCDALMLIGDPDYYGRFFGFTDEKTALWRIDGPVERHRLLARGAGVPGGAGIIRPAVTG